MAELSKAVDAAARKIFWSGFLGTLHKADLDGEGMSALVDEPATTSPVRPGDEQVLQMVRASEGLQSALPGGARVSANIEERR